MKSKSKIERQIKKKSNSELVSTIINTKKNDKWLEVGATLTSPRRIKTEMNLGEIDRNSKEGETIVIPGKVLSQGEITKKIKVVALSFSEKAKERLLKSKCEVLTINEEIKKNPDAKGIKILK